MKKKAYSSLFPLPRLRRAARPRRGLHSLPHLRLHPLRLLSRSARARHAVARFALTHLRHRV